VTSRQDDVEAFAARGFGGNLGFGSRPALVIVDLVNGFTDPASPLGSSMTAEVEATKIVLGAARVKRIPTFFTTVAYDDSDLQDSGVWAKKIAGLTILRNGSTAVQVDERLERALRRGDLGEEVRKCVLWNGLGQPADQPIDRHDPHRGMLHKRLCPGDGSGRPAARIPAHRHSRVRG